jgi:uncharacterized protein (TIGR03437 family)
MVVNQTRYELRAGESIPILAPQDTLDFLSKASSRHLDIGGLVAGPNRAGDQVLLGASLRTPPGEYTVKLSAASASGEQRETSLTVVVKPLVTVPSNSTRPPVVLLNGWEIGFANACPVANSSSDTFGNLAQYLVSDGVPVVYLFDNCLEDPGQSVEVLGNDLGAFLKTIKYDTGAQVPQIDLVGFSLGGLIGRAYLSGLQPSETLTPPGSTLIRKFVLIATPNFGSFVAGNYAASITVGSQAAELIPGSSLLWNLATWNQRVDDLRGVDAIAVIGNAGTYSPGLSTGTLLANASDGLVSLASASLGFVSPKAVVTRILGFCHVDPAAFTNAGFGTYSCSSPGIANVTSTNHATGAIVRSFLSGTTDWQSIGSTPATDPYLSINGGMFFALSNSAGAYVSDMSGVQFGTVPLTNGGLTGTIFYGDFLFGTGILSASSASLGTVNCGSLAEPLGYTSAVRCKISTAIFDVLPLASGVARTVNSGSINIVGAGFGSQCNGCKVLATPAGSTTAVQLTTTAWTNNSITATLPANSSGLVTIFVAAAPGSDAITVMVNPQASLAASPSSLQFAWTVGAAIPASQSIQITNGGSGTLSWTATSDSAWLGVSPASGTGAGTLTVSVAPAGLTAGTYTGSISIVASGASGSPASIGVVLTVTDTSPSLVVSPQTLAFQYANGGALPAAQSVAIGNAGGGTLSWTASSNAYWLVVSPTSGTAPSTLTVSMNPVNLAAGTYTGTVQLGSAQVVVTLVVTGTPPAPNITGITNAADFRPAIASGAWVSIFGTNLSQSTYSWQAGDFVNGAPPTSLQGVSVMINGVAAYVAYISPTQINVLAAGDAQVGTVPVQVTVAQQASNAVNATKNQFAPAFFTFGGGVYVAAQHADYSPVGPGGTPAKPGEIILLYGTGFGPGSPSLANPVQVSIGGTNAAVAFAGLAGPGLYQFNVTVPNLPSGDAPVIATIGGVSTKNVSLTVQ